MTTAPLQAESHMRKRVARGMGWVFVGAAAGKLLTAVCSIVLARLLGPEVFGQYAIVQSTVLTFAVYGTLRLGNTAIKYVAQYRQSDPGKAARILHLVLSLSAMLLGLVSAVVFVLSPQIARFMLKAPELERGLRIGALYLFFLTYGSIVQQALGGFENFKAMSRNTILRGALTVPLCIPLAYLWGMEGALVGLLLAAAAVLPQAFVFLRRERRRFSFPTSISLRTALVERPILWSFALPGFLVLALMSGTTWLVRVMLIRRESFAALGIFEAAAQWATVIYFIPTLLARVVMPILSASDGVNATADYQRAFSLQIRTILLTTGPATVLLLGLGSWIAMVYGSRYDGTERVMAPLFAAGFVRTLNEACRIVYESKGRQWAALGVYLPWAATFVGLCAVLLSPLGALGLALSSLAAELVLLTASATQVHLRLAPGSLTPNTWLFTQMLVMVSLAYGAQASLPPVWSTLTCLFLGGFALLPLLRFLCRSKVHLSALKQLRARLLRVQCERGNIPLEHEQ